MNSIVLKYRAALISSSQWNSVVHGSNSVRDILFYQCFFPYFIVTMFLCFSFRKRTKSSFRQRISSTCLHVCVVLSFYATTRLITNSKTPHYLLSIFFPPRCAKRHHNSFCCGPLGLNTQRHQNRFLNS